MLGSMGLNDENFLATSGGAKKLFLSGRFRGRTWAGGETMPKQGTRNPNHAKGGSHPEEKNSLALVSF